MSTTELFITSIVCAFAVGVLVTAMSYEWSYRRINKRLVGYRVEGITLRTELEMRQHQGTPYRPETVAAHYFYRDRPAETMEQGIVPPIDPVWTQPLGTRVVGGETMYSSDWLNDR